MTTYVITLMWGTAWQRYGQTFVETFEQYWPDDTELIIVTDRDLPVDHWQASLDNASGYQEFMRRWGDDPKAQGRRSKDRKAVRGQRFWKHDAVKWAPQGMAPLLAIDGLDDGDVVMWLDADVETVSHVPLGWAETLLDGHDVACLLRGQQHPEIGFWAIRLNDKTRAMVKLSNRLYASGDVFRLDEWHSAYVWWEAMNRTWLSVKNLNPTMMRGHCWPKTVLADYTVHKKGKLKDL